MKKLSKEKRDRIILVSAITVVALAGAWYCLIAPQQDTLQNRKKKIDEAQQAFTGANRLAIKADQFQKEFDATSEQLRQIEETMASGDMYSWIIKTMSRITTDHNVSIPNFSPPALGEVGMYTKFPYPAATFAIRGTAHFHDLGKFLADLENRFPCARVQNLDLEGNGGTGTGAANSEMLTFKFEFVTLVKPNTSL